MIPFWRGFSVVEIVTATALATAVGIAILPRYVRSGERARIAQVEYAMAQTATALAGYYVDHGLYPPSGRGGEDAYAPGVAGRLNVEKQTPDVWTANSFADERTGARRLMTFRLPHPENEEPFATLLSPIGYLEKLPIDPFARTRGAHLGYFAPLDGSGWMLFSLGPDRDENGSPGPGDISPHAKELYDSGVVSPDSWQPPPALVQVTYDARNGAYSNGDLWRVEYR